MPAGYSHRSLVEKLGIKADTSVVLVNAPSDYNKTLGPLPKGVVTTHMKRAVNLKGTFDFIQYFATSLASLREDAPMLHAAMKQTGMLWISWPKKSAGISTDLTENSIRDHLLTLGPIDVKVCAVDEIWSGLKFVVRVKDRK